MASTTEPAVNYLCTPTPIGMLDLGPRILRDKPQSSPAGPVYPALLRASEMNDMSEEKRAECFMHRHIYWVDIGSCDISSFGQKIDNEFVVIDKPSVTSVLVMPTLYFESGYVVPGRSISTDSIHDSHESDLPYYHLSNPEGYAEIGKCAGKLFAAGASCILLVKPFDPALHGVLIPTNETREALFIAWQHCEKWIKGRAAADKSARASDDDDDTN